MSSPEVFTQRLFSRVGHLPHIQFGRRNRQISSLAPYFLASLYRLNSQPNAILRDAMVAEMALHRAISIIPPYASLRIEEEMSGLTLRSASWRRESLIHAWHQSWRVTSHKMRWPLPIDEAASFPYIVWRVDFDWCEENAPYYVRRASDKLPSATAFNELLQ